MNGDLRRLAPVPAVVCLLLAACSDGGGTNSTPDFLIQGSGAVIEQTRALNRCDAVTHTAFGSLEIDFRPLGNDEIMIRAEDNIVPHIETAVEGTELLIRMNPAVILLPSVPIRYFLTVTDLDRLTLTGIADTSTNALQVDRLTVELIGTGDFDLAEVDANELAVTMSGTGDVVIRQGDVSTQTVSLSGTGDYMAKALDSAVAEVTAVGIGRATVRVRDRLTATADGLGSIRYCAPDTAQVTATGDVERLPDADC